MFINKTTPEIEEAMQKDFTMIMRETCGDIAFEHAKANVYISKEDKNVFGMSIRSRTTGDVIINTHKDGNHCASIKDALDKARVIIKKMK